MAAPSQQAHAHALFPHLFPSPHAPGQQHQEQPSSAFGPACASSSSVSTPSPPVASLPPYSPSPDGSRTTSSSAVASGQHVEHQQHNHRTTTPPGSSASYPVEAKASRYARSDELARFELLETLGTGTFGRVILVRLRSSSTPPDAPHPLFLAPALAGDVSPSTTEPRQQRPSTSRVASSTPHFALKVLAKTEIVRLKQVEHINNERAILGRVKHPFIVELYQTYQDPVNVYMLLSYVPGGELFSHLRRAGRFTPDVTRFYLSSIILAIAYLHSQDIIYRDLKPENLLLDREGYLRIADFGFAKEVGDRTFTLCGTPEYLAPEIVLSKGHGKAVDWWALGILCFEMLAGYPPFFDDNPMGIYEKILASKIAFPPHIDPCTKDLIRRLLTPDRSKRLGNLRGGAMDVMMHPWFSGVDWRSLEKRQIRAPIIPRLSDMGDTQNFQKYPLPRAEDLPGLFQFPPAAPPQDVFGHLFEDF